MTRGGRGGGRRGGGPIGALVNLVGSGVGMAQEYKEHRKELKQTRSASEQDVNASSSRDLPESSSARAGEYPDEAPPAYADATGESSRSLQSGAPSHGDNKDSAQWEDDTSDSDIDNVSLEDDDEDWDLDEAVTRDDRDGLPGYDESEAMKPGESVSDLVREVVGNAPQHPQRVPLPCPVILPQRRPRRKERGFVRAYAPVLEDCGIDQETFLKFLKNFYKSSQASPVFPIIQLAAGIAGMAPSVIAMAVTTAVQVGAKIGEDMQVRVRTNNFLERINEELFKPLGLFAMIIKYKSDAEMQAAATGRIASLANMIQPAKVDLSTNQAIVKTSGGASDEGKSMSERMRKLQLASTTTRGAIELPECAPLIFPAIDYKLKHDGPETFKDKKRDAGKFLADYLDRRAQKKYAMDDPNSSLAQNQDGRAFKSKLADPSHSFYQNSGGGLISLVSGGKVNPRAMRFDSKRERALMKDTRRIESGREPRHASRRSRRFGDEYSDVLHSRLMDRREMWDRRRGFGRGGDYQGDAYYDNSRDSDPYSYPGGQRGDTGPGFEGSGPRDLGEGSSTGAYGPSRGGYGSGSGGSQGKTGRRQGGGGAMGTVKRLMRQDVLYLMIVNLPSDAELREAREEMERAGVKI